MRPRIKDFIRKMGSKGIDAMLVTCPHNISYLTGIRSRDSYLLVTPRKSLYLTDSRYIEEAARDLAGAVQAVQYQPPIWKAVAEKARELDVSRVGFEERKLTVQSYRSLAGFRGGEETLIPAGGLVEELRLVKTPEEVRKIRKATGITMEALRFIPGMLTPGRTELEIAGELERFIRYKGAYSSSFDIIVASGPNSSLPHHVTSRRKLAANDLVYIDMGVDYEGYRSDLTRVFFLGKIATLIQRAYKVVTEAQEKAIRLIRPGARAADIDDCARRYISSRGFGGRFSHSLGHGVGLEVHEGPRISPGAETRLEEGMVFTVEPAVYIPKKFGIRVEDMVLVTRKGSEVLSGSLNK